jgi:hypothetical protein
MSIVLHPFRRKNPPARIPKTAFSDPYFFTNTKYRIIDKSGLLNMNGLISHQSMNLIAGCGEALWTRWNFTTLHVWDNRSTSRRMLKKSVQQGRSERRGEAYASVR